MRFRYQIVSSETGMAAFIRDLQAQCSRAASPGTTVEVKGTPHGAYADHYRLPFHHDVRQVIDSGLEVHRSGQYDGFLIGNSLDPAVVELRELLDVPVLTFMEVACYTACMMGERFGIVVPNRKFIPRYREIAIGYGLRDRMAGVEAVEFNELRTMNSLFADHVAAKAAIEQLVTASRRTLDQGAEVIIAIGPLTTLLAKHGVHEIDDAPVLDVASLLVTYGEMMVKMKKLTGTHVSRRLLYQSPPKEMLEKAAALYNIEL